MATGDASRRNPPIGTGRAAGSALGPSADSAVGSSCAGAGAGSSVGHEGSFGGGSCWTQPATKAATISGFRRTRVLYAFSVPALSPRPPDDDPTHQHHGVVRSAR